MAPSGDVLKALALIPAYSHVDHRLQQALVRAGVPWNPFYECSDLPKARSQLLTLGLEQSDADVFLLVDSDMAPAPGQIERLLSSPILTATSSVTGIYLTRDDKLSVSPVYPERCTPGQPGYSVCWHAGLGFAAVHRGALEAIAGKLPRVDGAWWPFCVPLLRKASDGSYSYHADDHSFWERSLDAGLTLWADHELVIPHVQRRPRSVTFGSERPAAQLAADGLEGRPIDDVAPPAPA